MPRLYLLVGAPCATGASATRLGPGIHSQPLARRDVERRQAERRVPAPGAVARKRHRAGGVEARHELHHVELLPHHADVARVSRGHHGRGRLAQAAGDDGAVGQLTARPRAHAARDHLAVALRVVPARARGDRLLEQRHLHLPLAPPGRIALVEPDGGRTQELVPFPAVTGVPEHLEALGERAEVELARPVGRRRVEHGPRLARERAAVAVELLVGPPVAGRGGEVGPTRRGVGDRGDEQDDARCGAAEHQWRRRLFPLPPTLTAAVAECGPTAIVTLAEPERRPISRPCTRSFSAVPPLLLAHVIVPPNPADTASLPYWPVTTWIALPSLSWTWLRLPLVRNFPAGMRRRARSPFPSASLA